MGAEKSRIRRKNNLVHHVCNAPFVSQPDEELEQKTRGGKSGNRNRNLPMFLKPPINCSSNCLKLIQFKLSGQRSC